MGTFAEKIEEDMIVIQSRLDKLRKIKYDLRRQKPQKDRSFIVDNQKITFPVQDYLDDTDNYEFYQVICDLFQLTMTLSSREDLTEHLFHNKKGSKTTKRIFEYLCVGLYKLQTNDQNKALQQLMIQLMNATTQSIKTTS